MTDLPVMAIVSDPCYWRVEPAGSRCEVLEHIVTTLADLGIPLMVCPGGSGHDIEAVQGQVTAERAFTGETERQLVAELIAGGTLSGVRQAYVLERGEAPLVIGIGSACHDLWLLNQVDIPFVVRSASQPPPPRNFESAWVAVEDLPDGLRAALGETLDELGRDVLAAG